MPHSNSSTPLIAASCKMNASGNGSTRYNTLNALILLVFRNIRPFYLTISFWAFIHPEMPELSSTTL